MQPHFLFFTKKGPLYEKSFAFTLWVVKLVKYLQSEKEFVLSKSALSIQVSQKQTKENFHDRGSWQRVEF